MRKLYPIYLNLKGMPCLVVGGGEVAARKVAVLVEAGASITLVSPEINREIASLVNEGRVKHIQSDFQEEHLEGFSLVIGATDTQQVNRAVSEGARKRGIWVNIVDSPDESDFFVPSMVSRGDLTIAISTGGKSPAMAKKVRKDLEKLMGQEYALLLDFLGKLRVEALTSLENEKDRASLFTKLVDSEILSLLRGGKNREAREEAERILSDYGLPYHREYLG
jgi:precorrin-2 dehydrogenase/sirohydrochlorin ferrochelatase